ncbi:MAG: hypothetical protein FWF87_07415 [Synergistaceae bacterium]|nr:hypothetical protein [Synergistaceae bacterium]
MIYIDVNPVTEVRRNRELLLEKHGGIDGLHKHMDEERPKLEKQGWRFVTLEEVLAKKHAKDMAVS